MQKTNIDWPGLTHTWNPVTGCKRGCSYCYARRIHERFNKTPFTDIKIHPKRLLDKMPKKPSRIFVGSMSDIEYWEDFHIREILERCKINRQHTFMFLSKCSWVYKCYDWPSNTMQGLTLTGAESVNTQHENILNMQILPRPFLSIEPLMGALKIQLDSIFEVVIVGAMTGPGAVPPKPEWIQSIKDNVPAEFIYWKNNIKKYL